LKVAVPVLVFYTTTIVRADGTVEFYDDIYDEDAKLEKRLARQRAPDGP
jgi:murein L,D-transpeptidase YcbB/YkuD